MPESLAIGVDLGATKIATALVTSTGEVVNSTVIPTNCGEEPDQTLSRIADEINTILKGATGEMLGVGIGVPGFLKPSEGILVYTTNLAWNYVNIIEEISSRLDRDLPIRIQTDANACVLGEYYFGSARECKDFLYTSIGSGLGGGAFCNGQLVAGANNVAGFLGLYSLDPNGRPDPSGIPGNTEGFISGRGLLTLTRELLVVENQSTSIVDSEELTPEAVLDAARKGDELACAAFTEMGRYLGEVWTPAIALLNPAMIVLAGGLGLAAFDLIIPIAKEELEARLSPVSYMDMEIVPSRLESSAVGAACLAFEASG